MNGGDGINTLGVVDDVVQPDNGMPVTGWLQAPRSAVSGDAGESLYADAKVVTAAANSGARGRMTIWLHGRSPSQPSSVAYRPLAGENQWTQASTA